MTIERIGAILIAILAVLGLPVAAIALFVSPMLFDSPEAGGWPFWLMVIGVLSAIPCLFGALIVAGGAAAQRTRPAQRTAVLLALAALLLPLVLTGVGGAAQRIFCHGTFDCKGGTR